MTLLLTADPLTRRFPCPTYRAETFWPGPPRSRPPPPRPRPPARVPRRRAVPLRADLRQRLLLRVRHVQHHRLDRPHAQGAAGEEFWRSRVIFRRVPDEGGVFRPRGAAAGSRGHPAG